MEESNAKFGRNKRTARRYEWSNSIQIIWMNEPYRSDVQPITLKARDISEGGMCLISRCMAHPGQFGIALLGRGQNETLIRGVEVRYCKYDTNLQEHIIGCSWSKLPDHITPGILENDHGPVLFIKTTNSDEL